jgi:crotonobetainyl-CoA:carnitine CoA-transferase CaiB-like acyl-CoA transferase
MGSPLDGQLVVDATSGVAGQLAGKVLARRGAEVTLAEPPGATRPAAPCFGEHSRFVLSELLGLDDAAIAELYAAGTVADQPEQGAEVS